MKAATTQNPRRLVAFGACAFCALLWFFSSAPRPKFHFLLAVDKPSPSFCRTLATALIHDYKPVLINWGVSNDLPYRNKAAKLQSMYNYLSYNVSTNDMIVMMDGSDMWIQQGQEVLLQRYEKLAAGGHPIILGADKKCYPDKRWCVGLPESPMDPQVFGEETDTGRNHAFNRPRYVNSGNVIGRAKELHALYSEMVVWDEDPFGDQVVFAQFYQNQTHDIRLDFEAQLFLSLGYAQDDALLMPDHYGIGPGHHRFGFGHVVWSRLTGAMPVSVHFPGKVKQNLFTWWPQMWWARLDSDEFHSRLQGKGVHIATTGEWRSWDSLCKTLIHEEQHYTLDDKFKEVRESKGVKKGRGA